MKSEQIAVQLFHSFFDLHGESTGVKYQNDYYIMETLCVWDKNRQKNYFLANYCPII